MSFLVQLAVSLWAYQLIWQFLYIFSCLKCSYNYHFCCCYFFCKKTQRDHTYQVFKLIFSQGFQVFTVCGCPRHASDVKKKISAFSILTLVVWAKGRKKRALFCMKNFKVTIFTFTRSTRMEFNKNFPLQRQIYNLSSAQCPNPSYPNVRMHIFQTVLSHFLSW